MAIKREKAYRLTKAKLCFCVDGMTAYALNHREHTDDNRKADKKISSVRKQNANEISIYYQKYILENKIEQCLVSEGLLIPAAQKNKKQGLQV